MAKTKTTNSVRSVGIPFEDLIYILLKEVPVNAKNMSVICYRKFGDQNEVTINSINTPRGILLVEYRETTDPDLVGTSIITYLEFVGERVVIENDLESI